MLCDTSANVPDVRFSVLIPASITAELTAVPELSTMRRLQTKAQVKSWKIHPSDKATFPWWQILCPPLAKSCEEKWCRAAGGKGKDAVVLRIPEEKPEGNQCGAQQRKQQRAVVGKSNPEEKCFSPRLFLQVRAGRGKCVSSAALSAIGLTVKEKLGGEGECGAEAGSERESERMGGPWYRAGGREEGDICSAVRYRSSPIQLRGKTVKCHSQSREAVETRMEGRMREARTQSLLSKQSVTQSSRIEHKKRAWREKLFIEWLGVHERKQSNNRCGSTRAVSMYVYYQAYRRSVAKSRSHNSQMDVCLNLAESDAYNQQNGLEQLFQLNQVFVIWSQWTGNLNKATVGDSRHTSEGANWGSSFKLNPGLHMPPTGNLINCSLKCCVKGRSSVRFSVSQLTNWPLSWTAQLENGCPLLGYY